jgi:hypothetical protein
VPMGRLQNFSRPEPGARSPEPATQRHASSPPCPWIPQLLLRLRLAIRGPVLRRTGRRHLAVHGEPQFPDRVTAKALTATGVVLIEEAANLAWKRVGGSVQCGGPSDVPSIELVVPGAYDCAGSVAAPPGRTAGPDLCRPGPSSGARRYPPRPSVAYLQSSRASVLASPPGAMGTPVWSPQP